MDHGQEERDDGYDPIAEPTEEDDIWSEEGWYFDLPAGAWERQEAKNRALRQNIRANVKRESILRSMERKKDPFDTGTGDGLGGWVDDIATEAGPNGARPDVWGDEADWDGETPAEPEAAAAAWEPAPAISEQVAADWTFREPAATSPSRTEAFVDAGPGPDPEPNVPRSRWDEMFGGVPDSGSFVDGMREWTERARLERERERDITRLPAELLTPFDWEEQDAGTVHEAREPVVFAAEPEAVEDAPLAPGVAEDDLAPASWNDFASPASESAGRPPKKNGLLGRVLGGRRAGTDDNDAWESPTAGGWEPRQKAASGPWEPVEQRSAPQLGAWTATEGRDDDTPLDYRPSQAAPPPGPAARMKGPAEDSRTAAAEPVRTWGAPPSDDDGSLHYDLPRRFTGRNVWDDAWLEAPPATSGEAAPDAGSPGLRSPGEIFKQVTAALETPAMADKPAPPVVLEAAGPVDELPVMVWETEESQPVTEEAAAEDEAPGFSPPHDDEPAIAFEAVVADDAASDQDPAEATWTMDESAGEALVEVPGAPAAGEPDPAELSPFASLVTPPGESQGESAQPQEADTGSAILHADRGESHETAIPADGGAQGLASEAPTAWPRPAAASPPDTPDPPPGDDPWAAFLVARESGEPHPFGSPATGTSGKPVSWNNEKPGEAHHAPMTNREPASRSPDSSDDQWAEVVAAAGYDDDPAVPIYTGRREDTAPLDRRLGESLFEQEAGPAARVSLDPDLAAPASIADPAESRREAWAEEDDVVLRAFEQHARSEPEHVAPAPVAPFPIVADETMDSLLGEGADSLVDEAMASVIEGQQQARRAAEPMPWEDPPVPIAPVFEVRGWDNDDAPGADESYEGMEGDEPYYNNAGAAVYAGQGSSAPPIDPLVLRARKRRGRTLARELVETLLLALLVFLAVRASFQNFKVDGNSMSPTLENGEFLIVNKLVYSEVDVEKLSRFLPFLDSGGESPRRFVFHGPERGDIVVLQDPRELRVDLIKRVIGLPGETIQVVDGAVFVNGLLLEEPYIETPWHGSSAPITLQAGEYFVMGDNRDNSKDSRTVGAIPKELIIGKAMLTYWPAGDFGLAPNRSPQVTDVTIAAYQHERGIATVSR